MNTSFEIQRSDWVEARLIRAFMSNVRSAVLSATAIIPVIAVVLYGDVSVVALGTWVLLAVATSLMRLAVLEQYRRRMLSASGDPLRRFMSMYGWTWPLNAVVWAGGAFIYFEQVPLRSQFVCLIVLVGMGAAAAGSYSAHLPIFRSYVSALAITILAAVLTNLLGRRDGYVTLDDQALILLTLIYWALLLGAGQRIHNVQRHSFELQYDNSRLIASLTEQTQSALEAVRTKNRLLASAAHDLRQPVHALALYADWLRAEPELAAEITPKILASTKAVNQLFDSLFDLARLEGGQLKVSMQSIDVAEFVAELRTQYAPLAVDKGLGFRLHVASDIGSMRSDPILLRRIMGNLVTNAIRYTDQGSVLLAARRHGGHCSLEVWDTGVGIAPEAHEEVFREFYKIERHAGTHDSFGLGLAIVRRLSEALDHQVQLKSRLDRGTVFRVLVASEGA